eukprot:NODE_25_length_35605_cov_0.353461.p2 type:complete len:1113 gc:universal NODE_25_length_35605_cov_0.353461:7206-10544(+)
MSDTKSDVKTFQRLSSSNFGYFACALSAIPLAISYPRNDIYLVLAAVACGFVVLFITLGTTWSVSFKKAFWFKKDKNGSYCFIEPHLHRGKSGIVTVHSNLLEFQKMKFYFDNDKLVRIVPQQSFTAAELSKQRGILSDPAPFLVKYGENHFQIPVPSFMELFKEHLVKPFFLFQLFCVSLWMFDEMWYYSLFTLFMLFVFEATVVMQRLRTLNEFHQMQHPAFNVYCYRKSKWTLISTQNLLPTDIISIPISRDVKVEQEASIRNPVKQTVVIETMTPCDCILLKHSCVVNEAILSGESTPVLKESALLKNDHEVISSNTKLNIVYGGTKVLQVTSQEDVDCSIPNPPDNGAIAMVLQTGFNTTQGELVRVMVFSSEPVSANSLEAFAFIGFLLIFAITAAVHVWNVGSLDPNRDKYKLFLNCIMIVTSCVPPELPMELSLAVNTSLMSLSKLSIFSTEPFRIPFAGRVDVCCFDKTGTLTQEELKVVGVVNQKMISDPLSLDSNTLLALCTAHSLVMLANNNEIVGDSMEKAVYSWIKFTMINNVVKYNNNSITIIKRFPFSSELARMGTISLLGDKSIISVKGAPERLKSLFVDAPANYDEILNTYAIQGGRVIAVGFKQLDKHYTNAELKNLDLTDIEQGLTFCGFLCLQSPLKNDAAATIKELHESTHHVVMITGDNPNTAIHVAKQLDIAPLNVVTITAIENKLIIQSDIESIASIDDINYYKFNICMTGKGLEYLVKNDLKALSRILIHVVVFARISPDQKEYIILQYKELGLYTLMAGDGSNDVGALKQAHVGIALLNGTEEDLDKIHRMARIQRLQKVWEKQTSIASKFNQPAPPPPPELQRWLDANKPAAATKTLPTASSAQATQQAQIAQMMMEMEDDTPQLKFGDASIAAPFTSKLGNTNAISHIIRQGRCTLVTTIQMYKILALNCLISAYSMSVLYLQGIKWGDWQMTIQGILLSVCFLCISKGKPIEKLSKERPQGNIFNFYVLLSVLGQSLIHGISFYIVGSQVMEIEGKLEFDFENKKKFVPTLLNTTTYLLSMSMQTSTFWVNYIGRPFREDIRENSVLYRGLLAGLGVAFVGVLEIVQEFNNFLQLVPLNDVF